MGMFNEIGIWDSYDDDEGAEPQYEDFDRIIHTTNAAILYGFKDKQFWLPKSVHHVETALTKTHAGVVVIEHWATYAKIPIE